MKDYLFVGDVRDGLRAFIDAGIKVQCCITSPPYFAKRDYGTGAWVGGDEGCDHLASNMRPDHSNDVLLESRGTQRGSVQSAKPMGQTCDRCGAHRIDQQLGVEDTPENYVETMVGVFRLVREILADDGVLFLNLGDTYCGSGRGPTGDNSTLGGNRKHQGASKETVVRNTRRGLTNFKRKDLIPISWMTAMALQQDGWWLRQCNVWEKLTVQPEAVVDRTTTAHEYVFHFSKKSTYYYDAQAIREPQTGGTKSRGPKAKSGDVTPKAAANQMGNGVKNNSDFVAAISKADAPEDGMRNRRSVWSIVGTPYPGSHFAVFPAELAQICILAGSRAGDTVLDPFMGSGTVANQAQELGRSWLGCELSREYAKLINERTTGKNGQMGLLL